MLIGIYGSSGFGREVMPLVEAGYMRPGRTVFIDDAAPDALRWEQFVREPGDKAVAIAIADSAIRQKLTEQAEVAGVKLHRIQARNVVTLDRVGIGPGSILCSFVHLTSDIRIGKSFHANIYSYVAHDCVIGDYVTLAPKACVNGNVTIGDHAYIGTGAVIKQGVSIGEWAVIGMGAVVTKDVAPGVTVIGSPAKPYVAEDRTPLVHTWFDHEVGATM